QSIFYELRLSEGAVAKRSGFHIRYCLSGSRDDAGRKPRRRPRLEFAGEFLRDTTLSPPADAAVRMRCAQVKLLPAQARVLLKLLHGQSCDFGRNDQCIRAGNDGQAITD